MAVSLRKMEENQKQIEQGDRQTGCKSNEYEALRIRIKTKTKTRQTRGGGVGRSPLDTELGF